MTDPAPNFVQAIQNAQSALQSGDKLNARRWAETALQLDPTREEPWLLMAAVASPLASVGYIEQALKINPQSQRARTGLDWAQKRVDAYNKAAITSQAVTELPPDSEEDNTPGTPDPPLVPVDLPTPAAAPASSPLPYMGPHLLAEAANPNPQTADTVPVKVFRGAQTPSAAPAQSPDSQRKTPLLLLFLLPLICIGVLGIAIWNSYPALAAFGQPPTQVSAANLPGSLRGVNLEPVAFPSATAQTNPATATNLPTEVPTLAPTATETAQPSPTALPTDTPAPNTYNAAQSGSSSSSQTSAPAYGGDKRIVVSISQQRMWVYEGSNLVYSFIVSTGIGNSTAAGTFSVLDKIPNAYGATWNLWMPNWLGIYYAGNLENGIHALPILSNGSILWDGYLGTPVSFGCVILSTADSKTLYDWVDVGVPVIIQR